MSTTPSRLGVDYMLGHFLDPAGDAHSVRVVASQSRLDTENKGVDALFETGRATKSKTFWMVPVPEMGDPVEALRNEAERVKARRDSFPLCTTCGGGRSKDPQAPCATCFTKQDGTPFD